MVTTRHSDDSTPPKRSVVCLSKYIPYQGISHAGGEYLRTHLAVLQKTVTVELLAPETPLNRAAHTRNESGLSAALLTEARPKLRGVFFKLFQIEATIAGSAMYWPVRRLFRTERAAWQKLAAADAIEFQWSEMISLAPRIRRRLPRARFIGVAHDINTQRWQRQVTEGSSWVRRTLAKFVAMRTRRQEARSFAALDTLIVFSEKDAVLAKALSPTTEIEVVHPGFRPKTATRLPDLSSPIVLLVGAMNRPENWKAALWFIESIWPTIHATIPSARFVVAGANPPDQLVRAIGSAPQSELTGFVESLAPWYSRASVCVVPLSTGAGVKFKTIDAMISGVPVVTTTVGAEGIDADDLFVALTDDPDEFARATISELNRPDSALTKKAQAWAERVYGEAAFAKRLEEVYQRVWSA